MTAGLSRVFGAPELAVRGLRGAGTNALEDAPVASAKSRYPGLVPLESLGGFRQVSTFQVEELVSHDYIVVGLDQPFASVSVTFPDGRTVDMSSTEEVHPLTRQSYLPAESAPVLHGQALEHGIIPFLGEDVSLRSEPARGPERRRRCRSPQRTTGPLAVRPHRHLPRRAHRRGDKPDRPTGQGDADHGRARAPTDRRGGP